MVLRKTSTLFTRAVGILALASAESTSRSSIDPSSHPLLIDSSDVDAVSRKSKNYDSASLRSGDEPDSATSTRKRRTKKLTKVVRRIGKALNKRLLQTEEAKPANLKNIIRAVVSASSVSADRVFIAESRLNSMKSVSSDNTSETCSSIDMDEMKTENPQLYSTILETVWLISLARS